ncbi:MAG: DUF4145 domain-containing protein [Flavobacteriales bacterium]|nr:DUF4145 domain-containing protein [Flavobacteriales bacterium]
MTPYMPPNFRASAFHCAICGAYANQVWHAAGTYRGSQLKGVEVPKITFAHCQHCREHSIWLDGRMVHPNSGSAPLPNPDMPEAIMKDYNEARDIVSISPRGSAALLRLAIQRLCKHLGESGENINADIAALVKKGLPEMLQQALDSVRVVGNHAVHPGKIDLDDNPETARSCSYSSI